MTDLSALAPLSPRLSAPWLERHGLVPLERAGDVVRVGSWRRGEEVDASAVDALELHFGAAVEVVPVSESAGRAAIRRLYGDGATARAVVDAMHADAGGAADAEPRAIDDLVALANEAPVVRLVNLLLIEALAARASDVHLEGYRDALRVRYRVDGVLQEAPSPPASLAAAVVSRLKIMADLDVAERRLPQDGRVRLKLQDRAVDVRVSTVPTLHGESVVLRLLEVERGRLSLAELGLEADAAAAFERAIRRPHGIVLVTGPTGSGKTTTLYAAVDAIRTGREKIVTVEDPVEYELPGVPQVPVQERIGVTFATVLRALLRQDPDIILVGEIRDPETAEVATQAALTGHLVLSTLHTNDAVGALTRLLDLGIAPYLVVSTVEAALAQRLVRLVCASCAAPASARDDERAVLGLPAGAELTRGRGCPDCRGTGYRGRTGLYELLVLDDTLRAAVVRGASAPELRDLAAHAGMTTLADHGLRLVRAGRTTLDEVLRVTRG